MERAVETSFRSCSALASTSLLKNSLHFFSFSISRRMSVPWSSALACSAVPVAIAEAASREISEFLRRDLARARRFMRLLSSGVTSFPESASRILFWTTVAALLVIFLLIYGEFRSVPLSAIVMLSLPLALIGADIAEKALMAVLPLRYPIAVLLVGMILIFNAFARKKEGKAA